MFLPLKFQKDTSHIKFEDPTFSNFTTFTKKYIRLMNRNVVSASAKSSKKGTTSRSKVEHGTNSGENNPTKKNEILTWLFSLSVTDRLKAVSIQNKWLSRMLSQMFDQYKINKNNKFSLFEDSSTQKGSNTSSSGQLINKNIYYIDCYFNSMKIVSPKYFVDSISAKEESLLDKILLATIKEISDTVVLHPSLVESRQEFQQFFDKITDNQFLLFSPSVQTSSENNRFFQWSLPNWLSLEPFNTPARIYAAFLDQILHIRYSLYMFEKENDKDKLNKLDKFCFSLTEDNLLDQMYDTRETLIYFLSKLVSSESKEKAYERLEVRKLAEDVNLAKNENNGSSYINYYGIPIFQSFLKDPVTTYSEAFGKIFNDNKEPEIIDYILFCNLKNVDSFEFNLKEKILSKLRTMNFESITRELLDWDSQEKNEIGEAEKKKKCKKKKGGNTKGLNNIKIEGEKTLKTTSSEVGCEVKSFESELANFRCDEQQIQLTFNKQDNNNKGNGGTCMALIKDDANDKESENNEETGRIETKLSASSLKNGSDAEDRSFLEKKVDVEVNESEYSYNEIKEDQCQANCALHEETTDIESKTVNMVEEESKEHYNDEEDLNSTNSNLGPLNTEVIFLNGKKKNKKKKNKNKKKTSKNETIEEEHFNGNNIPNGSMGDIITANYTVTSSVFEENGLAKKDSLISNRINQVSQQKEVKHFLIDKSSQSKPVIPKLTSSINSKYSKSNSNSPTGSDKDQKLDQLNIDSLSSKESEYENGSMNGSNSFNSKMGFVGSSVTPVKQMRQFEGGDLNVNVSQNNINMMSNMSQSNFNGMSNHMFGGFNRNLVNQFQHSNQGMPKKASASYINPPIMPNFPQGMMLNYKPNFFNNFAFSSNNLPLGPMNFNQISPQGSIGNGLGIKSIEELKKIEPQSQKFFTYQYKLHNDILEYCDSVISILSQVDYFKRNTLTKLKNIIVSKFKNAEIDVYGSFATDLSIECSDIDLSVFIDPSQTDDPDEINITDYLKDLSEHFKSLKLFERIVPIATASVPVIKLVIDPLMFFEGAELEKFLKFKESSEYLLYNFNKEELGKIKIDISFFENEVLVTNSKKAVEYIKASMLEYKEIKPLVIVLKRLLNSNQLNSSFNGGLSSYSLFILVLAYLRYPKSNHPKIMNLGNMLMEFLEFYGQTFKLKTVVIDINTYMPIYQQKENFNQGAIFIDPIDSSNNVAKHSYRIMDVVSLFSRAFNFLYQEKRKFEARESREQREARELREAGESRESVEFKDPKECSSVTNTNQVISLFKI